ARSSTNSYDATFEFSSNISIGSRGDARGGTFFGLVDEPAIYRRALSASEIQAIFNARSAGKCPDSVPTNHPPVAIRQSIVLNEDTPTNITLAATDADGDPLLYFIVAGPTNGTLIGTAPNLTYQ